jgi:thymidylate synthase ThyX
MGRCTVSDVAKIIKDSQHFNGGRLTTMELKIPTCVLAQFNTHRAFSRNAASMRAIPTKRIISSTLADPYQPEWLSNKAGMQGGEPIKHPRLARMIWTLALYVAAGFTYIMARFGLHKQVVNRLLSPWSYTKVVVTGTDAGWANFLALRADPHADPAIQHVAQGAAFALANSVPTVLNLGEWHLPYWGDVKPRGKGGKQGIVQSIARCARVSYATFETPGVESTLDADEDLYDKLLGSDPKHASPAEHQACAVLSTDQGGNLGPGWMQYRKTLANENVTDLEAVLAKIGYPA